MSHWRERFWGVVILAVVVLGAISLLFRGGGGEEGVGGGERADVSQPDPCLNVDYNVVDEVLRPAAPVRHAQAVRTSVPDGPLALPQNGPDRYLAVRTPRGVGVWATEREVLEGHSGLIFAADAGARDLSATGELADSAEMGIGPGDPDYAEALDCVR